MNPKKLVGYKASEFVNDGNVVGLGTGSTSKYFIEALAKRIHNENLKIVGVCTSTDTLKLANDLGIPTQSLDQSDKIDITVDGADEISNDFHGIKGGGGALLYEKLVATYSDQIIWIVDSSKKVDALGAFPLPVEVVCMGSKKLFKRFEDLGYKPHFRKDNQGENFISDDGNFIIDLNLKEIIDPISLAREIKGMTGVVEHGLFTNLVNIVIVSDGKKVDVLHSKK